MQALYVSEACVLGLKHDSDTVRMRDSDEEMLYCII